jgi:hypothetical protein
LTGDHSQEYLAKFGYKSERKEDFFEPPYILAARTYGVNLAVSKTFLKYGNYQPFFPERNALHELQLVYLLGIY